MEPISLTLHGIHQAAKVQSPLHDKFSPSLCVMDPVPVEYVKGIIDSCE